MTGRTVVVEPEGPTPLGARLLAAADRSQGGVVVLSDGRPVPAARLVELLSGGYGIGAVVPAEHPEAAACASAADLAPAVAARASTVNRAGLDARSDARDQAVRLLLEAARATGGRVVAEPSWAEPAPARPAAAQSAAAQPPPAGSSGGPALVVVTAALHDDRLRSEDRAAAQLIDMLARLCASIPVTVLCTERVDAVTRRRWSAAGLEVLEGPAAWGPAGGGHAYRWSHVVLAAAAASRSSVRSWIDRTQPQATRVVYFPSLAFREVSRLAPVNPPDEVEGLHLVRLDVEDSVTHLAEWAHAVWCQWPSDAAALRGWLGGAPVLEIPPEVNIAPDAVPLERRSGVTIVAGEGHDALGGHEDAALRALESVVPAVHRRAAATPITVIADRPSPMLREMCQRTGAVIVGSARFEETIRSARAVLACHLYGSGQPAVLQGCMEAGTPFVCTPYAAADLDLGSLAGVAVCAADEDQATRTLQLLTDDHRWTAVTAEARQVAQRLYSPARRSDAVAAAVAIVGLDPEARGPAWPEVEPGPPGPETLLDPKLPIRPPGVPEPAPAPADSPWDERPRYQMWHHRRGPIPEVLDVLRRELENLHYRPLISVLMPVYNTDPPVLAAAVRSVQDQFYDRWELCIANDGSDRPDTIELLGGLREDPRITVVDRPQPSGISEATNAALAVAGGEYVAFLDHDDELKPHALAQVARWLDAQPALDVVYTDEDKIDPDGELYDPHIKPDWSPDQLTSQNYICHLTVARRSLVQELGGLRKEFDGSQDYDLLLRLTERTDRVAHIPEPLYSWRAVPGSAAAVADAKPYAIEAARRAVADALRRRGYGNRVDTTDRIGFFRARYPIPGEPRVSIVVPTKDGRHLLERCLESVVERTTYRNYEILVVDNQSTDGPALSYMATGPWRVVRYPYRFNYARMMNLAARSVECDALLFLNNDTEVISPDWIEGLLEHAMRPEVGAVGGRLFFGDGVPQHEGIMIGIGGWAHNLNHRGYWARGDMTRNVSAVTGACTMIRPSVFARVGGNDERLRVAYNDVDLCLRIRQAGYQVVYTPHVELYHHESSTRGTFEHHEDGPLFGLRWQVKNTVDPYYSPMFEDFPPFLIKL